MLGGFWGPFRDNLAQVAGVSVTDIIDVLNDQLSAHFFSQQARPVSQKGHCCQAKQALGFKALSVKT